MSALCGEVKASRNREAHAAILARSSNDRANLCAQIIQVKTVASILKGTQLDTVGYVHDVAENLEGIVGPNCSLLDRNKNQRKPTDFKMVEAGPSWDDQPIGDILV